MKYLSHYPRRPLTLIAVVLSIVYFETLASAQNGNQSPRLSGPATTQRAVTPVSIPDVVARAKPSVCTIVAYGNDANEPSGQGTAWFLNESQVVTSRHVIAGAERAEIKLADGQLLPVLGVQGDDEVSDLAVLGVQAGAGGPKGLRVAERAVREGEMVIVLGAPLGLECSVSTGVVAAVREFSSGSRLLQLTAAVSPGSSGSPVLDAEGQVIGIVRSQMTDGQLLNFGTTVDALQAIQILPLRSLRTWTTSTYKIKPNKLLVSCLDRILRGESDQTVTCCIELSQLAPGDESIGHFYNGYAYKLHHKYEDAIGSYEQAIRIRPDHFLAHYDLGKTYAIVERQDDAVESYKKAVRIKPDFFDAHFQLGFMCEKLGQYQDAVEAYRQAIRIKPDYALAHCSLGCAYKRLARHTEAIESFKQAIRIDPDDSDFHWFLAGAHEAIGQYLEAIDSYKQAIRIKPKNATAHFLLGIEYLDLGDKGAALGQYKILQDLDKERAGRLFKLIYP